MRKALNENPRVQLAVFGVAALILAIFLLGGGLGGSEEVPPADVPPAPGAAGTTPAAGVPVPDPAGTAPAPVPAPGTTTAPPATDPLLPTKGLPEDVLVAYVRNKAIALIVIDPKSATDKQVAADVEKVGARDDVEVFVVKASKIAKYSRITQGVGVTRTPALIVIRPRDKSELARTATVSYGFRGAQSIKTALEDALYTGDERSTAP